MSAPAFELHILVLSEDSAGNALPALRALGRRMLRLIDAHYQEKRVDFEPEGEEAQKAMIANLYQGKKAAGHRRMVTLARAIARHIVEERGFVLFHVDADKAWSDQRTTSENIRRFHEDVKLHVARAVDDLVGSKRDASDKEAILSRLFLIAPHWCIESWLYQNTTVAKALCHKHYRGLHAETFDAWETDRGALDEADKPKDQVCLGSKHNFDLASQSFPARAVHEVGKSFHAAVEHLRASPALIAALGSTRPF